jgi:hypothetical protein
MVCVYAFGGQQELLTLIRNYYFGQIPIIELRLLAKDVLHATGMPVNQDTRNDALRALRAYAITNGAVIVLGFLNDADFECIQKMAGESAHISVFDVGHADNVSLDMFSFMFATVRRITHVNDVAFIEEVANTITLG